MRRRRNLAAIMAALSVAILVIATRPAMAGDDEDGERPSLAPPPPRRPGAAATQAPPAKGGQTPVIQPSCTDGKKNGAETDVDSGGGKCPQCAVGKSCIAHADCVSGACASGVCQPPPSSGGAAPAPAPAPSGSAAPTGGQPDQVTTSPKDVETECEGAPWSLWLLVAALVGWAGWSERRLRRLRQDNNVLARLTKAIQDRLSPPGTP